MASTQLFNRRTNGFVYNINTSTGMSGKLNSSAGKTSNVVSTVNLKNNNRSNMCNNNDSNNYNNTTNNREEAGGSGKSQQKPGSTTRPANNSGKMNQQKSRNTKVRQRPHDSFVKQNSKGRILREQTYAGDTEYNKAATEAPMLPPIGLPAHLSHLAIRPEQSNMSPRTLALITHCPSPQHVAFNNAMSRLAVRNNSTPDGFGRAAQNSNNNTNIVTNSANTNPSIPEFVFSSSSTKTPAIKVNSNHLVASGQGNVLSTPAKRPPSDSKKPGDDSSTDKQHPTVAVEGSDKAKIKFEKKLQKTVSDENPTSTQQVVSNPKASSPQAVKDNCPSDGPVKSDTPLPVSRENPLPASRENPLPVSRENPLPVTRESRSRQRKTGTKSGKKPQNIAQQEPREPEQESFSIRRKIEQFKKWHEEQYTDELKRLKGDGDPTPRLESKEIPKPDDNAVEISKIVEEKITPKKSSEIVTARSSRKDKLASGGGKLRPTSAATWKTWRDINESDAYNDVKKYIDDNDLMDKEREQWIKAWIGQVQIAMKQMGDDILKDKVV